MSNTIKLYSCKEAVTTARRLGWTIWPCAHGAFVRSPAGRAYRLRTGGRTNTAPLSLARELEAAKVEDQ